MNSPRSMFTEAIEDHLALKKQNAQLESVMPLARFDTGDPLNRFPGGASKAIDAELLAADLAGADLAAAAPAGEPTMMMPAVDLPEAAYAPADLPEVASPVIEADFRPIEPLNGMTPMLSLVEDIEEEDVVSTALPEPTQLMPAITDELQAAPVLRFPGGVGPRDLDVAMDEIHTAEEATLVIDESPVIVIDADEPLAEAPVAQSPLRAPSQRKKGRSFLGLGRKNKNDDPDGSGWFAGNPREFSWDD